MNSRLGYWYIAGSPMFACSITNEKPAWAVYFGFLTHYGFVRKTALIRLNRRVSADMCGGGEMRRGDTPSASYSIIGQRYFGRYNKAKSCHT